MKEQDTPVIDGAEKSSTDMKSALGYVPYVLAVGILIAYGFFIYFLAEKVDAEDLEWSRLTYLFSGVEAIVFAAAGFLFGREVNRKRAENAEDAKTRAENKKEEAEKQALEDRKKGLILGAMAIQEERTSLNNPAQRTAMEMATEQNPKASIAEKARRMYPELRD